jgi:predicted Zn finger-like uncharacterized protein
MKIVCPQCNFAREVPDDKVPDRPVKVTCPKCQHGFSFDKTAALAANAFDIDLGETSPTEPAKVPASAAPQTVCPACGLAQPAGESCTGCGVIYAKWAARHEARAEAGDNGAPSRPDTPFSGEAAVAAVHPADLPKAGFWIRFVASMIDGLILGAVQFFIGLLLGFAGGAAGDFDGSGAFALMAITWLCSMVVSVTYYVFFTGYNGQTPGKMALRIQVVRSDGTPMSYGRAFLREIPGKFVSGILLGIGYLMVAFDQQKQGLHDRIAGTYVIKL